jgi:hypothetical protein
MDKYVADLNKALEAIRRIHFTSGVTEHSVVLETLEDVIRETDKIGEIEHEKGIDHIWNVVVNIDDGIRGGDTYRILDFLVMCWQYGVGFAGQSEHYKRFVNSLLESKGCMESISRRIEPTLLGVCAECGGNIHKEEEEVAAWGAHWQKTPKGEMHNLCAYKVYGLPKPAELLGRRVSIATFTQEAGGE